MRKVHIEMAEAFKAGRPKAKTARNAITGHSGHMYRVELRDGITRLLYWNREIAAFDSELQTLKVSNGGYTPGSYGYSSRTPNQDGSVTTKALLNTVLGELGIPWRIEAHKCQWQARNYRTGQTVTGFADTGLWFNVATGTARKAG